jgi:hypothetical protein
LLLETLLRRLNHGKKVGFQKQVPSHTKDSANIGTERTKVVQAREKYNFCGMLKDCHVCISQGAAQIYSVRRIWNLSLLPRLDLGTRTSIAQRGLPMTRAF